VHLYHIVHKYRRNVFCIFEFNCGCFNCEFSFLYQMLFLIYFVRKIVLVIVFFYPTCKYPWLQNLSPSLVSWENKITHITIDIEEKHEWLMRKIVGIWGDSISF
jgi:hypothetical protein